MNVTVEGGEQFRALADAMPQFVWSARSDGTIEYFNKPWIAYTGLTIDSSLAPGERGAAIHPDEREEARRRWQEAVETGCPYEIVYRLRRADDGSYRWFIARATPVLDESGKIVRWIGTATDIDAQKRARDNLAFILEAAKAFSSSLDVATICQELARLAVKRFADWCIVTLVDGQGRPSTSAIDHNNPELLQYARQFGDRYSPRAGGALMTVVQTNRPRLVPNVLPDMLREASYDEEHLHLLESLQMHSAMLVPIAAEEGKVYGGVAFISSEAKRSYDQSDLDAAEAVARHAAVAIHNATVFTEEQRTSQRLRFIAKASEMLFESFDVRKTFDTLARLLVSELADFACIVSLENHDIIRVETVAHRDPKKQILAESLRGLRVLHPEAERRIVRQLRSHRPLIRNDRYTVGIESFVWPYLSETIRALGLHSEATIPLYSRGVTYGALFTYYAESGRTYDDADLPVLVELGRRASIAIENAKTFERERHIAATFQEASLPASLPRVEGIALDAVYAPGSTEGDLGGDWYDAFLLRDGSLVVSVGDVTGRGLNAAVVMGSIRQALSVVTRYERDPARMLDAVDDILQLHDPDAIVTAFVGVLDRDRRILRFANAGHPYPLLRRGADIVELRAPGLPLGVRTGELPAESVEASLEGAELIVFFTDGLTEATHDLTQGYRRLYEVLRTKAVSHAYDTASFIHDACLPYESQDDVAILTLRFGSALKWRFEAEDARAARDVRIEFARYLRREADNRFLIGCAEVIFGELIGNVVRHAPGPIDVQVDWTGESPVLHVIDRGPRFAAGSELPEDPLSENGRGLYIVEQLSDGLEVERIEGFGNHVMVRLPLRRKTV